MPYLANLLQNNKLWSEKMRLQEPDFFSKLSNQQAPEYLWIGCSDSRVPANQIVGLLPGELFVHRNVANVVVHSDLNCLSVMQFAVDVLKVKHIIVCGHYGCGGVWAGLKMEKLGLVDNWLKHIYDVSQKHSASMLALANDQERWKRLCELNVIEQVLNVCQSTVVQDAWARSQKLTIHGWIYGLNDGILKDLHIGVDNGQELSSVYDQALLNKPS